MNRLDDGRHPANVGPGYRNAQPAVGRTPAARSDEDILSALFQQPPIQLTDLPGDYGRLGGIESLRLDEEQVADAPFEAVAERMPGDANGVRQFLGRDADVRHFFPRTHGPELQDGEAGAARPFEVQIDAELQFHRTPHPLPANFEHLGEYFGQWKRPVSEHPGKGDHGVAGKIAGIPQRLIFRDISAGQGPDWRFVEGFTDFPFDEGYGIVRAQIAHRFVELEGVEEPL